jgi:hypothetical protein
MQFPPPCYGDSERRAMSALWSIAIMAKTELKIDAANLALRAAAIVGVIYGIGFLLMPYSMFQLSGDPGAPTNSGWVRWAGGFAWYF